MSKYYRCLLGFGVDWQLDRSLIGELKSEKRMQEGEEERQRAMKEKKR